MIDSQSQDLFSPPPLDPSAPLPEYARKWLAQNRDSIGRALLNETARLNTELASMRSELDTERQRRQELERQFVG